MALISSICSSCGIEFLDYEKKFKCPGCEKLDQLTQGKGIVRWFDPRRGYGFIRSEEHWDIFFHHTDLILPKRAVHPHVAVTFLVERTDSKLQARQIRLNSKVD